MSDGDAGADYFTPMERRQLRALLMRVGDEHKQRAMEQLAEMSDDIVGMVESKKATSAVLKFGERLAKWVVAVGGGIAIIKTWFWGGRS